MFRLIALALLSGVASTNAGAMRDTSPKAPVRRLLGKTGEFGEDGLMYPILFQ